jgi:uncharacterized BrkB/YihY/UPF0761 family membrane protein
MIGGMAREGNARSRFVFSLALGLYFSVSSSAAYGSLLSVIALLLWSSLSSLALHLGLAVTAELAIGESAIGGLRARARE